MLSPRNLAIAVSALGMALAVATVGYAVDVTKVKLYPDKKGSVADFQPISCLLYTSPSPRDRQKSRMPSSA